MISDPAVRTLAYDASIHPVAFKLYHLLADGKTLDEAAEIIHMQPKTLARYERQLRRAGYTRLIHEYGLDGQVTRRYVFTMGPNEEASRLAS